MKEKENKKNMKKAKVQKDKNLKRTIDLENRFVLKTISISVAILIVIALFAVLVINQVTKKQGGVINAELMKAMTYDEVEEDDEIVTEAPNVRFDAFFLRDINNDGYAESLRGTSKEIGNEDTLYMELNVVTAGYLKDAKITINGENFYLQTTLPKDDELKDNYIGNNIKEIEFNQLDNGTQKMITGIVRSGDYTQSSKKAAAIGNNINNYSKVNSVTLTGIYVDGENNEIPISKTVEFNIDWYGTTKASINSTTQNKNIENAIDEEKGVVNLDFTIYTQEINGQLILSSNHVEGEIPRLNGYAPIEVNYTGSIGVFNYDEETMKFTIDKTSTTSEEGEVTSSISRTNNYSMRVVYPIEAYQSLGTETLAIKIPVKTYYEGYNNPSEEFINPYKSNIASATIVVNYEQDKETESNFKVTVGKLVYAPSSRYIVSKEKPLRIYNGVSESETDDTYTVLWRAYIGTNKNTTGITMKETKDNEEQVTDMFIKADSSEESTDDVVSNVGIYFSGADRILGEEGWINVYDEDTGNLLVTFTANDWNKYTSGNPYKYEIPVKHIRVETSKVIVDESYLYVYNVKEIDDDKITEKYARKEFDELQYIKSTLVGYIGEEHVATDTHQANYEAPISVAKISILNDTISTQSTEENAIIRIQTEVNTTYNEVGWQNGIFLVKLPEEIIDAQINEVKITTPTVNIENYELIEQDGSLFIKIVTKNDIPASYSIEINLDLSPDPRNATATRQIELYASNENGSNYYYKAKDIYDVNNNLNTEEYVNHTTTSLSMVSPNSLLTNQIATNYDDKGSQVVSPEIADLKPIYAVVDQEQEEQTATIGVQIRNNYASTISEIQILGKIPFEGNTYVLNGGDLGSTFTTKMTDAGIEIPEELQEYATVYYSENENPSNDVTDTSNGWITADQVTNWDNIKTYLIDLGNYVMPTGEEYVFNYTVKIPNGLEFNKVAYSHHGVYFCLDTDQGKYKTSTEPNKLGFRIAEKYDLELTKYQTGKDTIVPRATYSVTEISTNEAGEEVRGESRTGVTNSQGKITLTNLYAEKVYEIKEIKSPDDYELNSDVIRFIAHVDEQGNLSIEKQQGTTKGDITLTKGEEENYKVHIAVEDEVKVALKIVKQEQNTEKAIQGVRFKITGYGLAETGKTVTTNRNGEITLKGLSINQEYTLEEVKTAEGYYLASPIKFKIVNENGTYRAEILNEAGETIGTENTNIKNMEITEESSIPTLNLKLGNEAIPTYNLQLIKIERTTESVVSEDELMAKAETNFANTEVEYLAGAKFKLYKGTEEIGEYTTDDTGTITIEGLYQYVAGKGVNQTYTLKEVLAPDGYAKVKDITFKVEEKDGTLVLTEINENGEETESSRYSVEENVISLTIEDSPSFKLIKKDAETGEVLAGIKFAIYNVDDGTEKYATNSKGELIGTKETINGKEYYVVETDENGVITADLTEGLYKAVEVQAPDKYDLKDQVYYFGIGASREAPTAIVATQATSIGGSSSDQITSVAATSDGGYIVGGYFYGDSITVGAYELTNAGSASYNDGMVIKYNSEGVVEWATSIGGSLNEQIKSVAETSDGGILVGGDFVSSSITVGTYKLINAGSSDGMVIKYDSEGAVEWATSIGGGITDKISSVTETSDGGILVGGGFGSSSITVGDYELTNAGALDGMVIKYDSEGVVEWATNIGGGSTDQITSVAETSDGGILVGGDFYGSITVGDYELTNADGYAGMVIKYDREGVVEWATSIGGGTIDKISSVTETSDGGILVGGYFYSSSITVGNYTLTNAGGYDGMVIKYDSEGTVEWATSIGGSLNEQIQSVAETSDGGILVGGYFSSSSITVGAYKLINAGSSDGMVIKYDRERVVEWATNIVGSSTDQISSVTETSDGGILVGGYFESSNITVGAYELTNAGGADGMVIKFEKTDLNTPITLQAQNIGGNSADYINSVAETSDGGILVGGDFNSSSITVGDYKLTNAGGADGMVIKYDSKGIVEWATSIGGNSSEVINSVAETSDGGILVGGFFNSSSITVGTYELTNAGSASYTDGMVIKYNREGVVEWATNIGGNSNDQINSVSETSDGGYIVGGYFNSSSITVGEYSLPNAGGYDGMVIKYDSEGVVNWATNIGGSSTDQINSVSGTSEGGILVGGYFESSSITVGAYELTNAGGNDGMVIKYDSEGVVEWATSIGGSSNDDYIKSVAETSDGGILVGGNFYSSSITVGAYELTNAGRTDGMVIKYDSKEVVEWATSIGGNMGEDIKSVAETSDGGILVGGDFYSSSITVGNYTLTNAGSVYDNDGMVIKYDREGKVEWAKSIGGSDTEEINSVTEANNGEYIAVGYFNSSTIETDKHTLTTAGNYDGMILKIANMVGAPEVQELTVENSRKEFKITTDVEEIDGLKGGNISGEDKNPYEKVKYGDNSTKEIKMTPDEGYEIIKITINGEEILNYEVDPEDGSYTLPQFTNMTEDKHIVVTYAQTSNKITIVKKDAEDGTPLSGAKFELTQVIEESVEEQYTVTIETNENGEATTQIPYGKYTLTEIEAPEGYEALENPITIEFRQEGNSVTENNNTIEITVGENGEFIVENNKIARVIVHHYLKTENGEYTTTKVAEDNLLEGKIGEEYRTSPHLDLEKYQLAKDEEGNYIIPDGNNTYYESASAIGIYESGVQEVIYYYEAKDIPLIVHHYIEGTEDNVPLKGGSLAQDEEYTGKEGEAYTTDALTNEELDEKYELLEIPENWTGTYTGNEIVVTYYYKLAERPLTIIKTGEDGKALEGVKFEIQSKEEAEKEATIGNVGTIQANGDYYFVEQNGKYISNNQQQNSTTANSYIKIDLTGKEAVKLKINAEISSQSSDYGYATIRSTETPPSYNSTSGQIFRISGETSAQDYETTLEGDTVHYLHLGYYKNSSTSSYDDTFTINSIEINGYDVFSKNDYVTNEQGKIEVTLEAGEYEITEIETLEGYKLPENPTQTINISKEKDSYELKLQNDKIPAQVIVHHYIYNKETGEYTTEKVPSKNGGVVEDEIKTGVVGDMYVSKASENIAPNYEYISVTGNMSGEMTEETIEIIYYYQLKDGKVTENTIEKTGTEKITEEGEEVQYNISYNATVEEYIGDAVVTIIDKLPYEITDETKLKIEEMGGVYNALDKTIIWTERVENIDTYTNGAKEIKISKDITVVYVNMDYSKTSFDNKAQGTIVLEKTKQEENTPEVTATTETEFIKQVNVTKVWNHTNNIYGIPEEVKVQVKNGDKVVDEKVLNNSNKIENDENTWTWTFTNLPKYDADGNEINYTVDEVEVNTGDLDYYKKEIEGTTIKNTYNGPVITANKEIATENGLEYVVEKEKITYTIKLQNSGELAQSVVIKDSIPEGTTFVEGSFKLNGMSSIETGSSTVDLTKVTAENLANGIRVNVPARTDEATLGETTVSFEVTVNALEGDLLTKEITNIATVNKNPDDSESPDEPTNEVTTIVNKADLEYSKESNPVSGSTVKEGDQITYTIHLDNSNGTAPTSVVVKDSIPEGTSFVEGSIKVGGIEQEGMTAEGLVNGITVDLAAGTSKDVEFKVTVKDLDNGVKIKNVATVNNNSDDPESPDVPTNQTEHTYIEPVIEVNKQMTTANGLSYVVEGEKIKYKIRIENRGDLAGNVLVKDNIPEGTTFVAGSIKVNGQVDASKTEADLVNGIEVNVPPRENAEIPGEAMVSFEVTVNKVGVEETSKTIRNTGYVNTDPDNPENEDEPTNEVKVPVLIYKKTAEIIRNEEMDKAGNNNISEGAVTAGDRIKYTITINNVGEEAITNVEIKDTVPEGTTIYQINDSGEISLNDTNVITWKINEIVAGEAKQVSFEVTVKYDKEDKIIKNVATVDGKPTNEVETPYEVPELDLESSIVKEGTQRITNTEERISYTINYRAEIREFVGKGKLKIVDYLPYEIDEKNSDLNGGKYNPEDKTITWEEDLGKIDTYTNENGVKEIERTKTLILKYMYPDKENISGTIENRAEGKITLIQEEETENPDNPDEPIVEEKVVKEETKEDTHEVKVEIPAKVIVHHYIYDEAQGGETQEQVPSKDGGRVADQEIKGVVGQSYDTNPSDKVDENYECINTAPEKHEGTMTKTDIEVTYYYKLKVAELGAEIDKVATASKQEEVEGATVQVLTKEDGVVTYKIRYRAEIKNYKGKAKITIVDKLPASLDKTDVRMDLDGGIYNATDKTITWEEVVQVDTFATGTTYNQIFEKEIKVVYKDQDVTTTLVNTAEGTVTIYYPEEHSTNPGGERNTNTVTDTAEVEQEYKVAKEVEKVWDDNNDTKGNRPESVTVQLTADGNTSYNGQELEKVVLNKANNWRYTFTNLPKYDEFGNEIEYSVVETETNVGDLEYYDEPVIISEAIEIGEDGEPSTAPNEKIKVTNKYKLMSTDLESSIEKAGTDKITASSEEVTYKISYKATVTEYIGEAVVRIVDTLPYKLAKDENGNLVAGIDLAGGIYDENAGTITWEQRVEHINTYTNGNYEVEIDKTIKVVYENLEATQRRMTNHVKGTIDLYETEQTNTVEDTHDTMVEIPSKVIVKYVDKETGEEITYLEEQEGGEPVEKTYGYEIEGLVGDEYRAEQKEILGYTYVENSGNTQGNMIEETIEVIYYYERTEAGGVHVTYVDEEGNEIAEDETYTGKVGDEYKTEQKDIYGYEYVRVEGEPEGEMTEGIIEVVYVYKKVPAKVIVRYLEKDDTPEDDSDNKVLSPEETIEGYVGDSYTTNRRDIRNYKPAEPEPENKEGEMTPDDIYVTYYYEKVPSGKVIAQYVDVDTGEEILYKDEKTGEYKTYREEMQGYIGDRYETEQKDIPYYKIVEGLIPANKDGKYVAEDTYVTYYYQKLTFNIGVDKNVANIMINGKEQKVIYGKLNKVEVVGSRIDSTDVKVTYSIKVSNTGEIDGTVKVVEDIPNNFKVNKETGKEWTQTKEGNLEAYVELKAGETKELKVVLDWIKGDNRFGVQKNTVTIIEARNPANYEEITTEDNSSSSEVVMGVKTGDTVRTTVLIVASTGMLITLLIFIYITDKYIKDLKKEEENTKE